MLENNLDDKLERLQNDIICVVDSGNFSCLSTIKHEQNYGQ